MMLRALTFALALWTIAIIGSPASAAPGASDGGDCSAIVADLSAARQAGDLSAYPAIFEAAMAEGGCDERARHCIGDALALGQLEGAYAAADSGTAARDLIDLAAAGLAYGAPWQLEAGLGDLWLEDGRSGGGGASYSEAALHFQQAMIAIGEPPVCADFGEAPRPAAADIDLIYQRLSAALLLADPLKVATTRCAPCQWLFLTGVAGFTPHTRPLPITFPSDSTKLTPAGHLAVDELLRCLMASGQKRIVLSGHADPVGSAAHNLRLSQRRVENVAAALKAGGYAGEIVVEARGEDELFKTEADFFPPEDELRLSRRIELKDAQGGEETSCQ